MAGPGSLTTLRIGLDKAKWDGQPVSTEVKIHFAEPAGEVTTIPVLIRLDD